jgi:hypothetical protein
MGTVNQDRYKGPYTIIKSCGKGNLTSWRIMMAKDGIIKNVPRFEMFYI